MDEQVTVSFLVAPVIVKVVIIDYRRSIWQNNEQDFSMRFVIDNVAFMRIRINPAAL